MQKELIRKHLGQKLLVLSILLTAFGCATISQFDQYAYTQVTSLKVDALQVMDLAADDFEPHAGEVKELSANLQKIYEYEKNRPKNEISVKQWEKLLNEDGHLLGGFIHKWQTEGKQSQAFINEMKKIIAPAFDQIAQLESKKIKPSDL
jgi:hypothetical protein